MKIWLRLFSWGLEAWGGVCWGLGDAVSRDFEPRVVEVAGTLRNHFYKWQDRVPVGPSHSKDQLDHKSTLPELGPQEKAGNGNPLSCPAPQ
jgi:hypothetical protein